MLKQRSLIFCCRRFMKCCLPSGKFARKLFRCTNICSLCAFAKVKPLMKTPTRDKKSALSRLLSDAINAVSLIPLCQHQSSITTPVTIYGRLSELYM